MAFNIGGIYKRDEINRKAWEVAARDLGIGKEIAFDRLNYLSANIENTLGESTEELVNLGFENAQDIFKKIKDKLIK